MLSACCFGLPDVLVDLLVQIPAACSIDITYTGTQDVPGTSTGTRTGLDAKADLLADLLAV